MRIVGILLVFWKIIFMLEEKANVRRLSTRAVESILKPGKQAHAFLL